MQDEASVLIHAPVDRVFAYMDDVSREHEWQPNLVEADQTPPGPTRLGTVKRYVSEFMGRRIENAYQVVVFQPDERVVYQTSDASALQAAVEVTWQAEGGGTRVTMRVDGSVGGPLKLIPKRLLARTQRKELEASLERLKDILES